MLLNLTDLSDEPLQGQISRQIRARILSGDLSAGESIPSIRGFARDHHVSVITVQRAYEQLEREGLIHSRRGKGFFISEMQDSQKRLIASNRFKNNITPIIESAQSEGLTDNEIFNLVKDIIQQITS